MSHTPNLEAQILEKIKTIEFEVPAVVLQKINKDKQARFRNTDVKVVAIFHFYQV